MKFFHLSDLHIGKQLHYYNLKENQRAVLNQIVERAKEYRPDAVVISGDIFDKSVPSGEAYTVFDEFLIAISGLTPQIPVMMIAGNHDNPQRLSYASTFLEKHRIHVSVMPPREKDEYLKKIVLEDSWGKVNFYLLPFLKPGYVRHLFEEGVVTGYESAVREILGREMIHKKERNVLLSHQFYTNGGLGPETCDSEQASLKVGGLDNVDAGTVEHFDYAALGHIHGAQQVKYPHIRYCGTPLKYSVSEEHHQKSITMVTMEEKGSPVKIETIPLLPVQEVRREKGLLADILGRATPENCHDFLSVTLTDEREPYHPMEQLEEKYDFVLELRVDNQRTREAMAWQEPEAFDARPMEVFRAFYGEMQRRSMNDEEEALILEILEQEQEDDR